MLHREIERQWLPIELAPDNCELEIGLPGKTGIVACHFPCQRSSGLWFNVWAGEPVLIHPTHWRIWRSQKF
jgi:hypothetical protein